jgi:hypothetical protein
MLPGTPQNQSRLHRTPKETDLNSWLFMIDGSTLRQLNEDHRARLAGQWGRRSTAGAARGRRQHRAAGRRLLGLLPARAGAGASAAADPGLLCSC